MKIQWACVATGEAESTTEPSRGVCTCQVYTAPVIPLTLKTVNCNIGYVCNHIRLMSYSVGLHITLWSYQLLSPRHLPGSKTEHFCGVNSTSLEFICFFFWQGLCLPVEKEMATHPSILAWRILWTEEPGGLQPMGSQRVGHK